MNGFERTQRFLQRKSHDRIPFYEHFWNDTPRVWAERGWVPKGANLTDVFGYDMDDFWAFTYMADLDFVPVTIEETETTKLVRDGNGALLRRHKLHDATPEHVDFLVKDRDAWEEHIKPKLTPDPRRIDFAGYRARKAAAAKAGRFFFWSGVNVFEQMHPVCGHEHMLVGMALDPDWIMDMADTYANLNIALMEILFEREGKPDGVWFYEDMGFKGRPFCSPAMYEELLQPFHKRTFDFAHAHGLPVVLHSCGFVEQLVPGLLEAGMDCLQVIEVKAGMDLLKLYRQYGEKLSFMGGLDVRTLCANDLTAVDRELQAKIPIVMQGNGFCLHTDHSVPDTVDIDTYRHFVEEGLRLGRY